MTQQWIRWTEFMQPWEADQFCEERVISRKELDRAAWVQEERHGHLVYRTDINMREVTVWRENGQLIWDSVYFHWIAEAQIDQLETILKERGFTGTRSDEITPTKHIATFQQGKTRLVIRASQREYKTLKELVEQAQMFLADCRFGISAISKKRLKPF